MANPLDAKAVSAFKVASRELRDPTLNKAHKEVKQGLETLQTLGSALAESPANGGRYVTVTLSAAVATKVTHHLNRRYKGYLIVKTNANAVVWVDDASDTSPEQAISLKSSAAVSLTLWIF